MKKSIYPVIVLLLLLLGFWGYNTWMGAKRLASTSIPIPNAALSLHTPPTLLDSLVINIHVYPIHQMQVVALEKGRIEKLRVENGAFVNEGDTILELSNTTLDLEILSAEADVAEKQNFLRNTRVVLEQERLENESESLERQFEVTQKRRAFIQHERLFLEELVAQEAYLRAKEDYQLALQRYQLVKERLIQDSIFRSLEVIQLENNLEAMQLSLDLVHKRKDNLKLRAPVSGQITHLEAMLGEVIEENQKIGEIYDYSQYRLKANLESAIGNRLSEGMLGIYTHHNQTYPVVIYQILPSREAGYVPVECRFIGPHTPKLHKNEVIAITLRGVTRPL